MIASKIIELALSKGLVGVTLTEIGGDRRSIYRLMDKEIIFKMPYKRNNSFVLVAGQFLSDEIKDERKEAFRREKIILERTAYYIASKKIFKNKIRQYRGEKIPIHREPKKILVFDDHKIEPTQLELDPQLEYRTGRKKKGRIARRSETKIRWTDEKIREWLAIENYTLVSSGYKNTRESPITFRCENGHETTQPLDEMQRKLPFQRCGKCKRKSLSDEELLPFLEARTFVHALKLQSEPEWFEYCRSGKKPLNIPTTPYRKYPEWSGFRDWLGCSQAWKTETEKKERSEKYKEIIESLTGILPVLPQKVLWYILDASGLNVTANEMRLLKKYQCGKLKLDDLVAAIANPETHTLIEHTENFLHRKYNPIQKACDILTHPRIAALDQEVIAAIIAELQEEIWSKIFRASMTNGEDQEIQKLKEILSTLQYQKGA